MVLMHGVPPLVGALGLAAVFSAEISAADAVLFMLTTSLSQDLYKRFVESVGRRSPACCWSHGWTTVVSGAFGVALAIALGRRHRIADDLLHAARRQPVRADPRRACTCRAHDHAGALASIAAGVGGDARSSTSTTAGRGWGVITPALGGLLARNRPRGVISFSDRATLHARHSLFRLDGKTAAVIGGGSGIGEAVAIGAAAHGRHASSCLDSNEAAAARRSRRGSAAGDRRARSISATRRPSATASTRIVARPRSARRRRLHAEHQRPQADPAVHRTRNSTASSR